MSVTTFVGIENANKNNTIATKNILKVLIKKKY